MSLRRFGLICLTVFLLLVASGLAYWIVMLNMEDKEEEMVSTGIKKVDQSANIVKGTIETNAVFYSDYLTELVVAGCLLTGLIIWKVLKYRCKINVGPTPPAPVLPDIVPVNHAPLPMPHPFPYMNYNHGNTAPPSYASATTTTPTPAPSAASFPVEIPAVEQVTCLPSTSSAKFKKQPPVLPSSTSESEDSDTSDIQAAKEAARAAKQKRRKLRKKEKKDKENTIPSPDNNIPPTSTPGTG